MGFTCEELFVSPMESVISLLKRGKLHFKELLN
jgi:hypothetical protein